MAQTDLNILVRHHRQLLAERIQWDTHWRELAEYMFPRRLLQLDYRQAGEPMTEELLDSTAYFSANVLASAIHGGLTNPGQRWMSIASSDPTVNLDDDVRLKLELDTHKMLAAFSNSNLTTELNELYMDLAVFGIGVLFHDEAPDIGPNAMGDFRGFHFQTYPVGSFCIEENTYGVVDTIFILIPNITAGAAAARWGIAALSDATRKLAIEHPERPVKIVQAVFPRDKFTQFAPATHHPFASVWYEYDKKHLLSEGGYHEFPFHTPRWTKASGEVYGRSPGMIALPECKRLNKLVELELKALALMVLPPQKAVYNSVIGATDFTPGGLTYMRSLDDLQPIMGGQRVDVAKIDQEEWRASIRRIFMVDQLLQLLARDTPAMTATEVQVKVQLLHQIIGPAMHRIINELLRPMATRGYHMMDRAGAFGEQIPELSTDDVRVEFEGPLVKGQRGQELLAIERVLVMAQGFAGLGLPDSFDNLNPDEALRVTAEISGAPETIIRSKEEVAAIRKRRLEEQETMAQLQQLQAGSEVARNVAPMAKVIAEGQQPR